MRCPRRVPGFGGEGDSGVRSERLKRRGTALALAAASSAIALGLVASTEVFGGESPATAKNVAGPPVGPSGQRGPLRYLENTGKEYDGHAKEFGPYRLIPAGTAYVLRDYPDDKEERSFNETKSKGGLPKLPLIIANPSPGWKETGFSAATRNGRAIFTTSLWESADGKRAAVSIVEVQAWALPIDIYLTFDDSLTLVTPDAIHGFPAITEGPNPSRLGGTPPPPPGGTVRVYFGGGELILQSDNVPIGELKAIAESLLAIGVDEKGALR
jgi:hypothetical protein